MSRIEEPSPPGVSRTTTSASKPSARARRTWFWRKCWVTGLMSSSSVATSTAVGRGDAGAPPPTSEGPRERRGREQKFPQTRWSHDGKDSIRVTSNPLCEGGSLGHPGILVKRRREAATRRTSPSFAALALPLPARRPASPRSRSAPCRGCTVIAALRELARVGSTSSGLRWHGTGFGAVQRAGDRRRTGGHGSTPPVEVEDAAGSRGSRERRSARAGGSATPLGRASNRIRYRIQGRVRDLRASFVRSPEVTHPVAGGRLCGVAAVVPRSAWGADESIRRGTHPATPRRSGSRSSTTRRERTTIRRRRPPRSSGGSRSTT